jgi:hypothetical protein
MEKIDWTAAKTAYITGRESYPKLAARFGVSQSQLSKVGTKEKWPKLRKEYREKTVRKAAEKASRAQVKELAKIYEASNILDGIMVTLLKELSEHGLDTIMGNGTPGRELESLSKALLNNDELKRRLNGILLPREAERLKLDREKFEVEKKKLEMEHSTDNRLVVQFEGDLEAFSK